MKPKKTLDELSNEALAAGLSYGQYIAMIEASSSNSIPQNNSPGMTTRAERSKSGRGRKNNR